MTTFLQRDWKYLMDSRFVPLFVPLSVIFGGLMLHSETSEKYL